MFLYLKVAPSQEKLQWQDESDRDYFKFSTHNCHLQLRKRLAQPHTYASVEQGRLVLGYRTPNDYEYLRITIDTHGNLELEGDIHGRLPLFYKHKDDSFYICNHYEQLRKGTIALNERQLASYLYLLGDTYDTLDKDIYILPPNSKLDYSRGVVNIEQISRRETIEPSSPTLFPQLLTQHMDFILDEYQLESVAIEASGGLDSSSLAVLSSRTGRPTELFAAEFESTYQKRQRQKLDRLASFTKAQLSLVSYRPEQHAPLSRFLGQEPVPIYEFSELYYEILSDVANECAESRHSIILSGIGGDELFEHQSIARELEEGSEWKQSLQKRKPHHTSDYMRSLREDYIRSLPDTVTSHPHPLPRSVYSANVTTNNIFIDRDIWPVAPLADAELYRYCQGLDLHFKANKNLLRSWFEAHHAPEPLYQSSQNEYFDTILATTIDRTFTTRAEELGGLSAIKEAGIAPSGNPADFADTPALTKHQLLVIEQNLRS